MIEVNDKLETRMMRPVDCSEKLLKRAADIIVASGEVPRDNLLRGIPAAEMLFLCAYNNVLIGVMAARHQQAVYHKHLFEKAGVPEMYNPHSLEICWLSVHPKYRKLGAWTQLSAAGLEFMKDRPGHAITRVANDHVADLTRFGWRQYGEPFHSDTSDDLIRLVGNCHDPVFDPNKKMRYS